MSEKALELLKRMVAIVDSGEAPARAYLDTADDNVDMHYDYLLQELDKARVLIAAASMGSVKSEKKAASSRENGKKGGRPKGKTITRYDVNEWLQVYRPHLSTDVINGNKGVYDKRLGQAQSFETRGKTWKQVLESFKQTE